MDSKRNSVKGIEETRDSIKTTIKQTKLNLENYISNSKKGSADQYKFISAQKGDGTKQIQQFLNRYKTQ